MSCADVCIDMCYDGDNAFHSASVRHARKAHKCGECQRTIHPGESYEHVSGKSDGSVWTAKTCAECLAIRKALVCGTWIYGQLWEEIENGVFPAWEIESPIDCLAKIEPIKARDAIRVRYAEWKQ